MVAMILTLFTGMDGVGGGGIHDHDSGMSIFSVRGVTPSSQGSDGPEQSSRSAASKCP